MSRHAPMEYRWEEADLDQIGNVNALAMDGWEVMGTMLERNRTVYLLMSRSYEAPPTVRMAELRLPPPLELRLVQGWEDKVTDTVAEQARRLEAGDDINDILRDARTPDLRLTDPDDWRSDDEC